MQQQQHDGAAERSTLEAERRRTSFDVELMTNLLDEGAHITRLKRLERLRLLRDPYLAHSVSPHDLTRPEAREKAMQQIRRVAEIRRTIKDAEHRRVFGEIVSRFDESLSMRLYVHFTLFNETIWAQGTDEQYARWRDDIEEMRVIGCFAMTELGHSSHLRGLETTATFERATGEFVLHSPTLTSTKWWIGMAGQTATHTVALAQLVVDGQVRGPHWFIVPLRTPDGRLCVGVTCGDVGAKAGRHGLDNGWIQFTHVRVPRENMLMRWAAVSAAGEFRAADNAAIQYNTLVGERIVSVAGMQTHLLNALTVAVRYGLVRRQGAHDEQIMDFQSHYAVLMPLLAGAYGLHFARLALYQRWTRIQALAQTQRDAFLKALPDIHAISASCKAHLGWWVADALELCRRSMGGHAYSAYAGIASVMNDYGVITTGGGDNVVLAQQHARLLLAALRHNANSDAAPFIRDAPAAPPAAAPLTAPAVVAAYRALSATLVRAVGGRVAADVGAGRDLEAAWNAHLLDLVAASRAATFHFWLAAYHDGVEGVADPRLRAALAPLAALLALHLLIRDAALFLEHRLLSPDHLAQVRAKRTLPPYSPLCSESPHAPPVVELSRDVRQNAAGLIDAFDLPDHFVRSPLGAHDGNVYGRYFAAVTAAPGAVARAPYWDKDVAPLTQAARL